MKRLEKEGCAWTKVCGEPDELLLWDLRTPDYNLSSITYQSRFCVYTCYMPVTETKLTGRNKTSQDGKPVYCSCICQFLE